jgi:hypothetical protein
VVSSLVRGGFEIMRKFHDSGGTMLENHLPIPPPPFIKCIILEGGESDMDYEP